MDVAQPSPSRRRIGWTVVGAYLLVAYLPTLISEFAIVWLRPARHSLWYDIVGAIQEGFVDQAWALGVIAIYVVLWRLYRMNLVESTREAGVFRPLYPGVLAAALATAPGWIYVLAAGWGGWPGYSLLDLLISFGVSALAAAYLYGLVVRQLHRRAGWSFLQVLLLLWFAELPLLVLVLPDLSFDSLFRVLPPAVFISSLALRMLSNALLVWLVLRWRDNWWPIVLFQMFFSLTTDFADPYAAVNRETFTIAVLPFYGSIAAQFAGIGVLALAMRWLGNPRPAATRPAATAATA